MKTEQYVLKHTLPFSNLQNLRLFSVTAKRKMRQKETMNGRPRSFFFSFYNPKGGTRKEYAKKK